MSREILDESSEKDCREWTDDRWHQKGGIKRGKTKVRCFSGGISCKSGGTITGPIRFRDETI